MMVRGMDFRALECFVVLAEELHFRRAAQRLNMTQPSLSARVKALEEEVGAVLLERDRRNVRLTAAGEIFRDYASSAMIRTEEAVTSARRAAAGESGQLRFGFTGLTTYGGMPELVQRFRSRFPGVEVELVNGSTDHLQAEMLAGRIDVALLHPPLACTGFELIDLPSEELVLAVPASSALASLTDIPLSRLQGEPFLLPPRHAGPDLYDQIISLFRTEGGFSPTVVQEVATMTTLIGLAAAGAGCGFVTRSLTAINYPGVRYRPLAGSAPRLTTALAWRAGALSAPATSLIGVAREWISGGITNGDGRSA